MMEELETILIIIVVLGISMLLRLKILIDLFGYGKNESRRKKNR